MTSPVQALRWLTEVDSVLDPPAHFHWIGNLNVYFESNPDKSVERHCAFGLKVPANSVLGAMFFICGAGTFRCTVRCEGEGWTAQTAGSTGPVEGLKVRTPPSTGSRGKVMVDVTRESDGKTVPVEFEFETVDGWGESLGCRRI